MSAGSGFAVDTAVTAAAADDDGDEQQHLQQQQQDDATDNAAGDDDDDDDDDAGDDDADDDDEEERANGAGAAAQAAGSAAAAAGPLRTGAWSPGESQALEAFVAGRPRRPTPTEVSPLAKRLRRTKSSVIEKLRGRRRRSSVARGHGRGRRAAGGGAELAGTTDHLWSAVAAMQQFVSYRMAAESARQQTANMAALLGPADQAAFARQPLAHLIFDNK